MNAIEVKNVGKRYKLKHEAQRTLKSFFIGFLKNRKLVQDFWALRGIDFVVKKGETLGIIGSNGAGKSTLLSLIARTVQPTEGNVLVNGILSSLLELGAGFHPDLTGRENIYLYGSIMGLSKSFINKRYDSIIEFSELKDFIDIPVKHYSSGMYVRLGFSVAIEVAPDILLIDEVLAVGDETFRRKCLNKIADFKKQGKTMLIVSHELETVKKVSDRVLLLDHGKLIEYGEPADVVDEYIRLGLDKQGEKLLSKEWGTKAMRITDVKVLDSFGKENTKIPSKGALFIELHYKAEEEIKDPVFGLSFADQDGNIVFGTNTQIAGISTGLVKGAGKISIKVNSLPLIRGKYYISFAVHSSDHVVNYHRLENWKNIWVESRREEIGFFEMPVEFVV